MQATPSHINGRFAPGNKAGVGHTAGKGRRHSSRQWIDMIQQECTPERWREVILRALDEAAGRVEGIDPRAAREWISKYVADPKKVDDPANFLLG